MTGIYQHCSRPYFVLVFTVTQCFSWMLMFTIAFHVFSLTAVSYKRHGVWNHRQLGCLFNSLLMLSTKWIQKHHCLFVRGIYLWYIAKDSNTENVSTSLRHPVFIADSSSQHGRWYLLIWCLIVGWHIESIWCNGFVVFKPYIVPHCRESCHWHQRVVFT